MSSQIAVLFLCTAAFLYRSKYPWSAKTVLGVSQRVLCRAAAAITGTLLLVAIAFSFDFG
jgi:hypothetical protein